MLSTHGHINARGRAAYDAHADAGIRDCARDMVEGREKQREAAAVYIYAGRESDVIACAASGKQT